MSNRKPITYADYNLLHRTGVINTWNKKFRNQLRAEGISLNTIHCIDYLVSIHDLSKLEDPEYRPYDLHYMDPIAHPKCTPEYRKAWNHHQKTNPHHWQYWVLMEDIENPKMMALEMDFEYVIEMLCDWNSASEYYEHTARWWYETQKENMILHPETKKLIEKYLAYLD